MGEVYFLDNLNPMDSSWNYFIHHWFDITEYYHLSIYHSYFGSRVGINPELFSKLRRWMIRNLAGEVIINMNEQRGKGLIEFDLYFEIESDLTAFKLMWHKELDEKKER